MKLSIKVLPSSSRDAIGGWLGDTLKVKVRAPAEDGRANRAAEKLVAKALELPAGSVTITSGHTSERKTVEIVSLSETEVYEKLSKPAN